MPAYGSGAVGNLSPGYPSAVWNDENVAAGASSISVNLKRGTLPGCFSAELLFAASPGTFAVDVQVADTDQDEYYVTKATLNTGLNATFVGRIEVTSVVAKFVRLKMVTLTNAVKVTAKLF